ncbi:proteasome-substrate-size regulator domain containing protein [Nitzschia inconspicua]|uniref:Proteasome-substrate-size regulator domain containing protein n=1 Tax=Nitzschia inconspicua TaxID=303405 RepID=A0A9K3LJE7_9STRA|nr:proteasome-substrate-size regulator domain containing protein [Nitzschia inconspicua]
MALTLEDIAKYAVTLENADGDPSWKYPHAFHHNLPQNHIDADGIPYITKFAHKKSRYILKLVESMHLTEEMLRNGEGGDDTAMMDEDKIDDLEGLSALEDDLEEIEGTQNVKTPTDLGGFLRLCARLQSQMSSLESLKHSGLSRLELSFIVLRVLRLVTATYSVDAIDRNGKKEMSVTIFYEKVGYIHATKTDEESYELEADSESLELDLTREFALPAPAREVLLSLVVSLLSNKGLLRSVSNAAVFPKEENQQVQRFLLIIHWKALLRTLLRTAPYLDEHKVGGPPMASNSRQSTVVKRTVQLIRDARHFFDQGLCPYNHDEQICDDRTAREVWGLVKKDVLFHSHTHACYRSLVIFYLFSPSRCSTSYYLEMMPLWFDAWTNIDRCPDIDFLWLALFSRARKHLPPEFDWGEIRRRLLTHSQYWLQLPIGGGTLDKSFPNAGTPRSRSCPSRLKVFSGSSSSYEEGIDFVAKVTKLIVIGLGTGDVVEGVSEGTREVLRFLNFVTPYFNPSNLGSWTFTLGAFLHYFSYEFCCRIGIAASMNSMKKSRPELAKALNEVEPSLTAASIPPHEVVSLMDALLPLCQQSLYSKNGHVGRAGEAAMLYLAQIDPSRVTPTFLDFATRALDITAVNLAHQAPAALSALTRLVQPSLRSDSRILLARLPNILRLTLAGIDSNDQNKTIRTLIFYRSLTSWFPVGGSAGDWIHLTTNTDRDLRDEADGTTRMDRNLHGHLYNLSRTPEYIKAVNELPQTSLLMQGNSMEEIDYQLVVEEASSAMSDWVLEFLERVYALLRATGEREKTGKTASGVANRHSSADVQQARNFSRVLKESLVQTFASMDDEVHGLAVKSVVRFLSEETLPDAAKDTSFLCLAVASARIKDGIICSPGFDGLVPVLMDELEHHSNKTVCYRLRCLSGAVRSCGVAILKHQGDVRKAIKYGLSSRDKHVYKTACKLLRHTLSTLCESYPVAAGTVPRTVKQNNNFIFGMSAQLHNDPIQWHVPDGDCIQFAWDLMKAHLLTKIQEIPSLVNKSSETSDDESDSTIDLHELRRCLRAIRYALRGGAGALLDLDVGETSHLEDFIPGVGNMDDTDEMQDVTLFPYEKAMNNLLRTAKDKTYDEMIRARGNFCVFIIALMNLIATDTFHIKASHPGQASEGTNPPAFIGAISHDSKICKEASDVALLLLTRRGAAFRSQEGKTIWKAQKQLATDFAILSEADHIAESLQRAQMYGTSRIVFFKDGEDAGKTLPRRLLVTRVQLFHDSLQRTASFEVPRRLRRLSRVKKFPKKILFSKDSSTSRLITTMACITTSDPPSALDAYEGLMDGLFSLCCHSNTQVRSSAIGVVDYAITRYGWLVLPRVPRLLAAVKLQDEKMHGKFGLPSCSLLKEQVDSQGRRKRLSEAMKGVCSLLAVPRAGKQLLSNEKMRYDFITTICGNEDLVSLMPAEEMQKMVHYFHSIFSPFRLKFFSLPRASSFERRIHFDSLSFLLDILSKEKAETTEDDEFADEKAAHWRKLLHACWFLTVMVDEGDIAEADGIVLQKLWKVCFQILEHEYGQPLQRVGLGLFGRLLMIIKSGPRLQMLRDQLLTESFCKVFGEALVYDHKEDTSVGGGHSAQWATGVADMIRDSARNIAPRSLFPFQRTNQSSGTFKVSHAQMIENVLVGISEPDAVTISRLLLSFAKELASSPPSEDQRNSQCTSAEIFAGVLRSFLLTFDADRLKEFWESILIPFLDEVIPKIPISLLGAYFDSVRFGIQFSPPNKFYPMTLWLFAKIEESLWDPKGGPDFMDTSGTSQPETDDTNGKNGSTPGSEGFTAQSKWLYLCAALLIELDETELDTTISRTPWYTKSLTKQTDDLALESGATQSLKESWNLVSKQLLPRLIEALGHPYDSCRDHISGLLFRICYCHRKMSIGNARNGPSRSNSSIDIENLDNNDPGSLIMKRLLSLQTAPNSSSQTQYNSLITARRFFSYCIHFGEAKYEFSDYLVPLLPLAFEALKSTVDEGNSTTEPGTVAKRALEAEVVKGYRYTIAEVSIACVISYGGTKGELDITRVLDIMEQTSKHDTWQIRHACANFLRCFQGSHKFLFSEGHAEKIRMIVASLLADGRREVSSAAMAAVTGIIAAMPSAAVAKLVDQYVIEANRSKMKGKNKKPNVKSATSMSDAEVDATKRKEENRAKKQQSSVFFLCATILSQPYDTPPYIPKAIAAISKHSYEKNAPLSIRDIVKKCCAEYKKTHMSDNWEVHRDAFSQEELEALFDVVSSPHYYA